MSRLRAAAAALLGRGATPLAVTAPASLLEHRRRGSAPLAEGAADTAGAKSLSVAVVVPSFRRGSGGHRAIAELVRGLEARGHHCSLWICDEEGRHAGQAPAELSASFSAWFGPVAGQLHASFERWSGVDVAVATGWQTVPRVLLLGGVKARAYLVLDHEPEFHATSAEREWAAWTYDQGLHAIAGSQWLAGLLRERYGASADGFDFGIDHDTYRPLQGVRRRDDRVLFYARAVTARRAVPLGLLALSELRRRRPQTTIALFGESRTLEPGFCVENLGVLEPAALARAYGEATAGVVLSMTNPSLIGPEMLACGLPVVELASDAMRATFGGGPMLLAPFDPLALADAIEGLLDDPAERERRAARGLELAAGRTWGAAAAAVEAGLRSALTRAAG